MNVLVNVLYLRVIFVLLIVVVHCPETIAGWASTCTTRAECSSSCGYNWMNCNGCCSGCNYKVGQDCSALLAGNSATDSCHWSCSPPSIVGTNCQGNAALCTEGGQFCDTSTNPPLCNLCPAGSFCIGTGAVTACNTGYTTAGGTTTGATAQSQCSECAAGFGGTSSSGTSGCTACTAGTNYKVAAGNGACAACDANASSGSCTATSPGICNVGYSSTDSGVTCTACISGTYKMAAGNTACVICEANDSGCGGSSAGS